MSEHKLGAAHRSALEFVHVITREAHFSDSGCPKPPTRDQDVTTNIAIEFSAEFETDRLATVRLGIRVAPDDGPTKYFNEVRVVVEGAFRVGPDVPPESLESFVRQSAPALLVPYAREALTRLTTYSRMRPLLLPPINMVKVIEEIRAKEAQPK